MASWTEYFDTEHGVAQQVHLCVADTPTPILVVRDHRGAVISQLEPPLNTVTDPDAELRAVG